MIGWWRFGIVLLVGAGLLAGPSIGFCQLTPAQSDAVVAVANNWLHLGQEMGWGWAAIPDFSMSSIEEIDYQGELVGFSLATDDGYIVIPAYRELPPISAYSTTSSPDFDEEYGFCGMLKEVLSDKIQLVRDYFADPNPPPEWTVLQGPIERYRDFWVACASDYQTFTKAIEDENRVRAIDSERETAGRYGILDMGPLMTSSWHQGYPYNDLCPMGDGGQCVVGCVATATSQILYYHRSPISGIGSYTYWWDGDNSCGGSTPGESLSVDLSDPYDWGNIIDDYTGSEPQVQKDAVAELCYEVGVAENMMYGVCGSGTYHTDAMDAFRLRFGYSDDIDMEHRAEYDVTGEEWFAMLQEDLNQRRPLQYGIRRHSIVCDGWRVSGTNQVHMNYGWDSEHNAWYTVDELFCTWDGCSPWVEEVIRRIIPLTSITLLSPNGDEVWYVGEPDTIQWMSDNYSGNVNIGINFSYPAGPWESIVANTANDGIHLWQVTLPVTSHARVRLAATSSAGVGDTSDCDFTISDGAAQISVTSPNGGEVWFVGETEDITWTSGGITGNVMIELDRDYPSSWDTLFESTADDGIESWEVAGLATSDARVRISSVSEPDVYDISNADFSIDAGSPPVILHDAKDDGEPGSILFVATVTADVPPTVRLFWRPEGSGSYDSTGMVGTGNPDEYSAMVSLPEAGKYEYYLKAEGLAYQVTETGVYDFDLYPSCGLGLWYDDGGAERYNWAGDTRFRWAVRFTPESVPYILCGAWFSVSRTRPDWSHQRVRIEVYDSDGPGGFPGTVLLRDTTGCIGNVVGGLPPDQTYWAGAHLRDGAGEPLVFNGDFYVAVGNPDSAGYEAFSRDTTGSVSGRSYLYDGCLEQWYLESDVWENCRDGNRLIRVVGYYQEPPVLVVTQSGDDAALSWTPSGSPYYRVYSDTTPLGAFGTFEGSTSDTTFVDVNAVTDGVIKFYQVTSSTQP